MLEYNHKIAQDYFLLNPGLALSDVIKAAAGLLLKTRV
jgi:hypothetical protein